MASSKSAHPWYIKKRYVHFDVPLELSAAEAYVTNPDNVAAHPFLPFLRFDLIEPRSKRTAIGPGLFGFDPKHRPISYASHRDGYIYAYYKYLLNELYESHILANGLDRPVAAFRSQRERSDNVSLARDVFSFISTLGQCDVYATDITGYYDHIDHGLLKQSWGRLLSTDKLPIDHFKVLTALTQYRYVRLHKVCNTFNLPIPPKRYISPRICTPREFRERIVKSGLIKPGTRNKRGIPQGSAISPCWTSA